MAENGAQVSKQGNVKQALYDDVENRKFSWFHIKAILISGVGFYTDAYDLFVISIIKPMIGILYYPQFNGKIPLSQDLWITGVALAGTLLGQVGFGLMGDYLGRKKVYLITLMLIIGSTIGQCLSASTIRGVGFVTILCFWRFVLGIGIGGDYPLSATIVAEYANRRWRGGFLSAVFACQGFGIVSGSIIGIIVTSAYQNSIKYTDITYLDYVWRIIIGLGCVPAVLTIYLRSKLPETPRYVAEVERDTERAVHNLEEVKNNNSNFNDHTSTPVNQIDRISHKALHRYLTYPSIMRNRNIWVLFGTCSCWFLLDIAFYSQNLFLPNVLTYIGYNPSVSLPAAFWYNQNPTMYPYNFVQPAFPNVTLGVDNYFYNSPVCSGACAEAVYTRVFKTCAGNAIVAMMGTVPGYWFSIAFMDRMGRIPIQFMGFTLMTALLICLAAGYQHIVDASQWIFIVMYAFTFFFANFGPNTTTFIVPVELFNTKYRSTLHGMSAASGKAGAIVGAFGLGKAFSENSISLQSTLAILATTNFIGMFCTIFVPETNQLTLEDASTKTESLFGKWMRKRGTPQVIPEDENEHLDGLGAAPKPL
jgi:PHS family inorganic phosphate transporter-like MFS transporter